MPQVFFVYKFRRGARKLLSEHLHLEDAFAKAARIKGSVITDELGKVVRPNEG